MSARRLSCGLAATSLAASAVVVIGSVAPAAADVPAEGPATPTVTRDVLPTVQINGIVWSQATVGNTVYAVGNFSSARPAGSAAGQNETPRANILAYDIRTGVLDTSFVHTLNGQAFTVTASPDGSRIYVGGEFTQVDGKNRQRIAAFSTGDGTLLSYAPVVSSTVQTIAVTSTTVYLGGRFNSVNGNARGRLAATTPDGGLLSWAPTATGTVRGLAPAPDGSKIFVGGSFSSVNGQGTNGVSAVDPTTGASIPIAASAQILAAVNNSDGAGVYSLRASGGMVLLTGYGVSAGSFEGSAALDPAGNITWLNDCWGDSYDAFSVNGAVYVAGHAHSCAGAQWFPDTKGTPSDLHYFGLAYGANASSQYNVVDGRGWNYSAFHTSSILQWNPTFTGGGKMAGQSVWSFTGNSQYVAAGGEFPAVNSVAQQGLVRFAVHALAPNLSPPRLLGNPTAQQVGQTGAVTVSAQSAWDPDDGQLTYLLVRDGDTAHPVDTATLPTVGFWQQASRPMVTLTDPAAPAGTHSYTIRVKDGGGSVISSSATTITIAGPNYAIGQPATQSSTAFGGTASRAVDGNTDGNFNNGSVSHTGQDPYSWWQVDLGQNRTLGSINVFNRSDCCANRLTDYYVFVSGTPFDTTLTPAQQAAQPGVWSSHQVMQAATPTQIGVTTTGRYVMVQENVQNQFLQLAEVQVFPG